MLTELNNHKTSFFICPEDSCTGCTACMNVCSHAAISFIPDEEGFLHPSVDKGRVRQLRAVQIGVSGQYARL
jgi:related to F420H2-dehydrogenase, beta subunit